MAIAPPRKMYGPKYEARVAADKKARAEKKAAKSKARAEKKATRKAASKKRREASAKKGPIKTAVQKSPKYKGAPEAPKVSKRAKSPAEAKRKKAAAAADKSWSKATKARKAAGGPSMSTLVKARSMHKKGSADYAKIQNKINEAYGVKKRHEAPAPKKAKAASKKAAPYGAQTKRTSPEEGRKEKLVYSPLRPPKEVTVAPKPKAKAKPKKKDVGGKEAWKAPGDKYRLKKQLGGKVEPPTAPSISPQPSYEGGGKVSESNPYGWPSRDARNGGKK